MVVNRCFSRPVRTALVVALLTVTATHAADMTSVSVSGFNRDVVVENTASGPPYSAYAVQLNPGEGLSFYQSGLPGKSYGLPASGSFTSVPEACGTRTASPWPPSTPPKP